MANMWSWAWLIAVLVFLRLTSRASSISFTVSYTGSTLGGIQWARAWDWPSARAWSRRMVDASGQNCVIAAGGAGLCGCASVGQKTTNGGAEDRRKQMPP